MNYKIITWNDFEQELLKLFKISEIKKENINSYFDMKIPKNKWISFIDWKNYSDLEIWKNKVKTTSFKKGKNIIITFNSFRGESGPYEVYGHEIENFIRNYRNEFNECLFSGMDVIILNFDSADVFIFHHEDIYTLHNLLNKT